VCAYHCVQLSYTTHHRRVLITFSLILQTIIMAQTMSVGGRQTDWYQIIPFGDRDRMVQTTCPELLCRHAPTGSRTHKSDYNQLCHHQTQAHPVKFSHTTSSILKTTQTILMVSFQINLVARSPAVMDDNLWTATVLHAR